MNIYFRGKRSTRFFNSETKMSYDENIIYYVYEAQKWTVSIVSIERGDQDKWKLEDIMKVMELLTENKKGCNKL